MLLVQSMLLTKVQLQVSLVWSYGFINATMLNLPAQHLAIFSADSKFLGRSNAPIPVIRLHQRNQGPVKYITKQLKLNVNTIWLTRFCNVSKTIGHDHHMQCYYHSRAFSRIYSLDLSCWALLVWKKLTPQHFYVPRPKFSLGNYLKPEKIHLQ